MPIKVIIKQTEWFEYVVPEEHNQLEEHELYDLACENADDWQPTGYLEIEMDVDWESEG